MPTQEVRRLVAEFEANRKAIMTLQTKKDKLQRNYKNVWYKIRMECEKVGHDNVVGKQDRIFFAKHFCPYCRKLLFPVRWDCDSWDPDSVLDKEFCSYWLEISENDWPPEKAEMLRRIKLAITNYFREAEPLLTNLQELYGKQSEIRNKLEEIFKLCDSILKVTERYEETIRRCSRKNKSAPPFNDPDAFRD